MKTSAYISIILFSIFTLSCSTDDNNINSENGQDEPILTNYIYKTFKVSNTPNTVIDSTNYSIENNRITNTMGLNFETLSQRTSHYNYVNGKIDEIQSFIDSTLSRIETFTYNSNGDLVTYLSESITDQSSSFERHLFTHTNDTIFSNWTRSNDGVNFDNDVADYKIVLDDNDNRTYLETYSHLNDDTSFEINTYDSNSNSLNDSKYLILDNGNEVLSFENNYTTNSTENLFNRINEATYTRKTLMLLYHLQSGAVNTINAKSITKNTLVTFEITWGNSFAQFEISNTLDENNLNVISDFKTFIQGTILTRFSQDFLVQ